MHTSPHSRSFHLSPLQLAFPNLFLSSPYPLQCLISWTHPLLFSPKIYLFYTLLPKLTASGLPQIHPTAPLCLCPPWPSSLRLSEFPRTPSSSTITLDHYTLSLGSRVLVFSFLHPQALFFLSSDFILYISSLSPHPFSPNLSSFLNLQYRVPVLLNLFLPSPYSTRFLRVVQNNLLLPFFPMFTSRHPGIFQDLQHISVCFTSLPGTLCTTSFTTRRP